MFKEQVMFLKYPLKIHRYSFKQKDSLPYFPILETVGGFGTIACGMYPAVHTYVQLHTYIVQLHTYMYLTITHNFPLEVRFLILYSFKIDNIIIDVLKAYNVGKISRVVLFNRPILNWIAISRRSFLSSQETMKKTQLLTNDN